MQNKSYWDSFTMWVKKKGVILIRWCYDPGSTEATEESQTSIMTKIKFTANKVKQTKNHGGCCCSRLQCVRESVGGARQGF